MLSPLESLPFELLFMVLEMVMRPSNLTALRLFKLSVLTYYEHSYVIRTLLRLDSVSQRLRAMMRESKKGIWRKYQLLLEIDTVNNDFVKGQVARLRINNDSISASCELVFLEMLAAFKSKGLGSCVIHFENHFEARSRGDLKRTRKDFDERKKLPEIASILPPVVVVRVVIPYWKRKGCTHYQASDEAIALLLNSEHKATIRAVHLIIECNQDVEFEYLRALGKFDQLDKLTIQLFGTHQPQVMEQLAYCIRRIRITHLELDKVTDSDEGNDLILALRHTTANSLSLSGENLAFLMRNVCLPEVTSLHCRRWPSRKEWLWNMPTVLTNLSLLHIRNVSLGSEKLQKMFHLLSASKAVFPSSIIICSRSMMKDEAQLVVGQVLNKWPNASVDRFNYNSLNVIQVNIADGRTLRLPICEDYPYCPCDLCDTKFTFEADFTDGMDYSSDDYSDECLD